MAESTTQNPQTDYKFLDLGGLQKVWGKIKSSFTTKTEFDSTLTNVYEKIGNLEESVANTAVSSVDNKTIVATDSGKISASIGIRLNDDKQLVELYATGPDAKKDASGQEVEGKEVLGSFSYTKFLKDGMLENVELVVVAPSEGDGETSTQAPGTYLKFTFNTDGGSSVIYVPVDDLVNVYEGSDYISVSGDVISLKKDELTEDLKSTFMTVEEFNNFKASYDEYVESVNASLNSNSEAIAALQESLNIIQPAVEKNTSDIETINGTLTANGEAIAALQESLNTIQPAVAQNTSDLGILTGRVDSVSDTVTANSNSISELLASLNLKANQESVDSLAERVSTNESEISELNKRVAELGQVVGPDGELISIHVSQITGLDPISDDDIESACS